jgi:hypothetical protein
MENDGIFYGQFGIFCGHLVYLIGNVVIIWSIFHRFGILCQEKSGNPARGSHFFSLGSTLTSSTTEHSLLLV